MKIQETAVPEKTSTAQPFNHALHDVKEVRIALICLFIYLDGTSVNLASGKKRTKFFQTKLR